MIESALSGLVIGIGVCLLAFEGDVKGDARYWFRVIGLVLLCFWLRYHHETSIAEALINR